MKLCPICKGTINKGSKMAIVSTPVEAINNDADYSIMIDFLSNETIVHSKCFHKIAPNFRQLSNQFDNTEVESVEKNTVFSQTNLGEDLRRALFSMGEKVSLNKVQTFLIQNDYSSDLGELITLWFKKRDSLE